MLGEFPAERLEMGRQQACLRRLQHDRSGVANHGLCSKQLIDRELSAGGLDYPALFGTWNYGVSHEA